MNELIDKFLFELFDGLRDKNNCSVRRILLRMRKHWQQSLCYYILE